MREFSTLTLRSSEAEVVIVPELGGRVVCLKNLRSGRDWLSDGTSPRLFANEYGDDFAASPLCGWDECVPTISACEVELQSGVWVTLPDHGEAWSVPWRVEQRSEVEVTLRAELRAMPLTLERKLSVRGSEVLASYSLANRGENPCPFLWAMHPLFVPRTGDRLELTEEAAGQLQHASWLETLEFGARQPACAKVFARHLPVGRAAIRNAKTGDGLVMGWDTKENSCLGIWLTRGGWNGCHHLALEPTSAATDSLAEALKSGSAPTISPQQTVQWSVRITLESSL